MIDFFQQYSPITQVRIATFFTWSVTAAGAMIFVVVEELIPKSQRIAANIDLVTMATMAGFSVMMALG